MYASRLAIFLICMAVVMIAAGGVFVYRHSFLKPAAQTHAWRQIQWTELTPAGWQPPDVLKGLDPSRLSDADPQAIEALKQLKNAWENAPVVNVLDKQPVRIAGYVIPLDREWDEVREFLLVPYFGACIHVPPPPSNQIIYVRMDKPIDGMMTMDTLWVSGILHVSSMDSPWGRAAYSLQAVATEPFIVPSQSNQINPEWKK